MLMDDNASSRAIILRLISLHFIGGFGSQMDPVVYRYIFGHVHTECVYRRTVSKSECVCVEENALPAVFCVQDSLLDDGGVVDYSGI
jgi:hypothetical protein